MEHLTRDEVAERFPDPAGNRYAEIKSAMAKATKDAKRREPKVPREARTYRGARRNAARGMVWMTSGYRFDVEVKEGWSPGAELNRSDKWPRARSYAYAREISPVPERPVR